MAMPITTIPTPVEPLVDENGQVTMSWRAWFRAVQLTSPSNVTWTTGTGAPTSVQPVGSLYSGRTGRLGR